MVVWVSGIVFSVRPRLVLRARCAVIVASKVLWSKLALQVLPCTTSSVPDGSLPGQTLNLPLQPEAHFSMGAEKLRDILKRETNLAGLKLFKEICYGKARDRADEDEQLSMAADENYNEVPSGRRVLVVSVACT